MLKKHINAKFQSSLNDYNNANQKSSLVVPLSTKYIADQVKFLLKEHKINQEDFAKYLLD